MPNSISISTYIAGIQHYIPEGFHHKFLAGDVIELKPEPSNKFDPHAVEVFWRDVVFVSHKVGYVPRFLSKEVSTYIAAGRNIKAKIDEDSTSKITIFEEKEAPPSNNTI